MSVGVIGHVMNPSFDDVVAMATVAEENGADWIGFADAFWWRDVWMLLARVAEATNSIEIGPAMTNPYLRHPFHTASALATLQELAPGRVFCGIAAGGSEVTGAARIPRDDAPERVAELIGLLRRVERGESLDPGSGRSLDVRLHPTPILVAGRGDRMLMAGGAHADRALLWSIPDSDLSRSAGLICEAASDRAVPPDIVWAPLVAHDEQTRRSIMNAAVYASINTAESIRSEWGLETERVEEIRASLIRGGTEAAIDLVPSAAIADLVTSDAGLDAVADRARRIGATSIAVPCYDPATLPQHIQWARAVDRELSGEAPNHTS